MSDQQELDKFMELQQYMYSDYMYERVLDAALSESDQVSRMEDKRGSIRIADSTEVSKDVLQYFLDNKEEIESEFESRLRAELSPKKVELYYDLIQNYWIDGRSRRDSKKNIIAYG